MAGTIIADFIRTDANRLSLNVGNTTFATINASGFFSNTGTQLIAANGKISGASLVSGSITSAAFATAANTIPRSSMTSGAVLQVVYVPYPGNQTLNTGTATSVLSGSITPTSATSKILVSASVVMHRDGSGNVGYYWTAGIYKTTVANILYIMADAGLYQAPADGFRAFYFGEFLDSPATTSAVTYGIVGQRQSSGSATFGQGGNLCLTLMEIAA